METYFLRHSIPEVEGISSLAILRFVESIEKKHLEMHSFMLLRHGSVIASGWWKPYSVDEPHMLYSLSKSFTSTAIGLAVDEGYLSIEDQVISFFPDDLPAIISANLAAMRVKHLLTMTTGHAEDTTGRARSDPDGNWVRGFLSLPVENTPGKPFVYNTAATYMLSAILQKVTGMTLLEYLKPRLFDPLGINNPTWETCPKGINTGGFGLSIRTEEIARFGQMYLKKGMWNGKQLVPSAWVEEATRAQVSNATNIPMDWKQGYGYQFWRCQYGAYRGDGAFGQYCIVMPEQDAVLAITSGVGDMQAVLNLVWKHLLGNMKPVSLRSNPGAMQKLESKLSTLALPFIKGVRDSSSINEVSGKEYTFKENKLGIESVRFDFDHGGCTFTCRDRIGEHTVSVGSDDPRHGMTTLFWPMLTETPVTTGGAWIAEDTYVIKIQYTRTPYSWTVKCQFSGEKIILRASTNVSFEPVKIPSLTGFLKK